MRLMILADAQSTHTLKWVNSLSIEVDAICLLSLREADTALYHHNIEFHNIDLKSKSQKSDETFKIGYLQFLKEVKKQIRNFKPDILHAYYATSYGLIGALSNFKPFVISVWGSDIFEFPQKSILHKQLLKYNLNKATIIQSTSKIMAKETMLYTTKKVETLAFGIDLNKFKPKKTNDNSFIIGTIKMLEEVYGINYLIEAFNILLKKHTDINLKLMIVGDGPKLNEYKELTEEYGIQESVTFVGAVAAAEAVKYHNMMSVFVALSLSESFGVSILEAAACGIPSVVSNVGGLPEIVIDGKTGFIVEPRSPEQAAEAISKYITDPSLKDKMGENARLFVEQNYDWKNSVSEQLDIYSKIIKI